MRLGCSAAGIVAVLSGAASVQNPANATEITLGGMTLSSTEWSVKTTQGTLASLENGAGGGVMAVQPTPYSGSREVAFHTVLQGLARGADWDIEEAMLPHGYEVLFASDFAEVGGVRTYFVPVAIYSGGQMAVLTLVDPEYRGKGDLQDSFGDLLSSLRFSADPEPATIGGQGRGVDSLDGFYAAIGAKTSISVLGQPTVEVGTRGLWLHSDGRFVLTEVGITMDPDSYCAKHPKSCGRYRVESDEYRTWRIATKQQQRLKLHKMKSEPFRKEGRDLVIGETRYRHISPVSDLRLDGQYQSASADSSTGPSGERTVAYAETLYAFLPDGRFFKGGYISNFSSGMGVSSGVWGNQSGKTGRYKIDRYTLTIDFDNGEREEKAFFLMDEVPVINGDMYRKIE